MAEIEYEYYELVRHTIYKPEPNQFIIVTASVGSCALCRRIITGMGGGPTMICVPCGNAIKSQRIRFVGEDDG